jgi:hypothetical protein
MVRKRLQQKQKINLAIVFWENCILLYPAACSKILVESYQFIQLLLIGNSKISQYKIPDGVDVQ